MFLISSNPCKGFGFRNHGLRLSDWGSGIRVWGFGIRGLSLGYRDWGLGIMDPSSGFRVYLAHNKTPTP